MKSVKTIILLCIHLFSLSQLFAQNYTVSGYVKDKESGESMIGVNIFVKEQKSIGITSNYYGFYSLSLPLGKHTLVFSYIGFPSVEKEIQLSNNLELDVSMSNGIEIKEVVVSSKNPKHNVESTDMGNVEVNIETVKKLPALMGEVDLMKVLQLLPGVSSASEGTSSLFVRGGGPDQNLVLLDEAIVYNTGHLLGFFSVFNSDAIKNVELIKGSMPAEYGSRISSVIDVQMKEGNNEQFVAEGGIGIIASRFTVQGPIQKSKSSFIVSTRRTYALDIAQPFIKSTNFAGTNYYFYDLNAKVNYQFSRKDRLYISTYFGRDVFSFSNNDRGFKVKLPYGNGTGTIRWNHLLSDNTFFNLALITNNYNFSLLGGQEEFSFNVNSGIRDYSVKMDLDYYPNPKHQFKMGARHTFHKFTPNVVNASNGEVTFQSKVEPKFGHETEAYISDIITINSGLKINAGLRVSLFNHIGPYTSSITNDTFGKNELVKRYFYPEPRISINKSIDNTSSVKAGFTLATQYVHLVSNSGSTLPADVWVPSTEKVKPQIGIQYAVGYYKFIKKFGLESSVEVYYKTMYNQLDYRENYIENFSTDVENEFVSGAGRAYGAEFLLRRNTGRFTGWIGYTISKTERWFDEIEEGRVFPTTYDRPHDLTFVGMFELTKKWDVSTSFIYATGRSYTPIQSLFLINNSPNIEYGPRNSKRIEDYHRADISFVYTRNKNTTKKFTSSWAFSIYNFYNHKNPFFTYTDFESNVLKGELSAKEIQVSIFTIIPSITWNFKWKAK